MADRCSEGVDQFRSTLLFPRNKWPSDGESSEKPLGMGRSFCRWWQLYLLFHCVRSVEWKRDTGFFQNIVVSRRFIKKNKSGNLDSCFGMAACFSKNNYCSFCFSLGRHMYFPIRFILGLFEYEPSLFVMIVSNRYKSFLSWLMIS